jgi:signal transduction histidine kinase
MKRGYLFNIFLLLFASINTTIGQPNKSIDSLKALLKTSIQGQKRVDIINELAFEYYDFDDSLGLYYAKKGLTEAIGINYNKGIKYAYLLVGIGNYSHSDHKSAIRNLRESISIVLTEPDKEGLNLYAMSLLGNVYRTVAKYDSARFYYQLSRKNFDEYNKNRWSTLYKNVAILNLRLWENEIAIKYLDSARAAINLNNAATVSFDIYISYVNAYQNLGKEDSAQVYLNLSCNNNAAELDNFSIIKCYLNQSRSAYRMGEYPSALTFALKALKSLEEYAYPPQQVEVLTRIGEIYTELSEYTLATRYYLQALAISEQFGFDYEKAYLLCELGWVYKDQRNFKLALDYVNQSQKIREAIGDNYGIAICHNTRGLIYHVQKKFTQSIQEHEKAKKIREEIAHKEGIAASLFNISIAMIEQGLDDKALQYMMESIKIEEGFNNKQSLAISYDYLASFLIKKGRLDEAEKYLIKCRDLADQTESKLLKRNNAGYFSDFYEAKGDFKRALEFRKLYQQLNDSIYSQSGVAKLAEMQALYQLDKMEQQIMLLDKENALKESDLQYQKAQLRQQRLIIIASLLVVLLISGIAFIVYRYYRKVKLLNRDIYERNEEIQAQSEELTEANLSLTKLNQELSEKREEIQAQSEELQEANQTISEVNRNLEQRVEERTTELRQAYKELDTFFYRSSHDFRRPLTTFMGLAEVARVTVKDERALELFSKVNETAHYLDKMLFKLQSISDLGAQEIVFKEVFIKDIFDNVCDLYRDGLKENRIKATCTVNLKGPFNSYPALLKIIFENLIENSIFFHRRDEPSPFIALTVYETDQAVVFQFEDNGQGISEDFYDRVFEMYFRGSERSKGNGLGLYIVKKAIEKLGGTISLESKVEKGTTFKLEFTKF